MCELVMTVTSQRKKEPDHVGIVKVLYFYCKSKNLINCSESVLAGIRHLVFINKGIQRYLS